MSSLLTFNHKYLPRGLEWCALFLITGLTTYLLELVGLPASFLLGPMFAGIICEALGFRLRISKMCMPVSQAVIGCLIAKSLNQGIVSTVLLQWPVLLGAASATLLASIALGWLIGRAGILPGTTAIWGMLPGAATSIVLLAEDFGADPRLVAFMQYLRVLVVTLIASVAAKFWAHIPLSHLHTINFLEPLHTQPLLISLCVVGISLLALLVPKISGGVLILSMSVGGFIQFEGYSQIELPFWLFALAFAVIGWNVGLRFTKDVLIVAAKALPQTIFCISLLILFCMGSAATLVHYLDLDPLTAYLGTSPGGVDSAAIIGASTRVDLAFVMALQIMRFLITLILGPYLSKVVANFSK